MFGTASAVEEVYDGVTCVSDEYGPACGCATALDASWADGGVADDVVAADY